MRSQEIERAVATVDDIVASSARDGEPSFGDAMRTAQRLSVAAEALAALGARLRADVEGIELEPQTVTALDRVVDALGIDLEELSPDQRTTLLRSARAFHRQASDLLEDPGRAGWAFNDSDVLLAVGQPSMAIAGLIAEVAPKLDGLEQALRREGALICDVGAGVAALSIALCETFPQARVVGLEPWDPALAIAEREVARAGLSDRIDLRPTPVEQLADAHAFDAVWLPGPFLPEAILPSAFTRSLAALKPGGWILFGVYSRPPDSLGQRLTALRTVRSGGSSASPEELGEIVSQAGFADVHTVERTWDAALVFVAGRKPPRLSAPEDVA